MTQRPVVTKEIMEDILTRCTDIVVKLICENAQAFKGIEIDGDQDLVFIFDETERVWPNLLGRDLYEISWWTGRGDRDIYCDFHYLINVKCESHGPLEISDDALEYLYGFAKAYNM